MKPWQKYYLKEHATSFEIGSLVQVNSWILSFSNPFRRSLGQAVALLAAA